ncbi:hypothetical protein SAMN05216516_1138 [Izhakiella capsodis]|uniref:Uncharacterized protein n=1 Tax=Izhakiella capsodis TaxID=1367852 RepID=A0A1I5ASD5_9GAMM|nr:hypothetical protein SAMN05216516_1138 [Izhakiella capsodis]
MIATSLTAVAFKDNICPVCNDDSSENESHNVINIVLTFMRRLIY